MEKIKLLLVEDEHTLAEIVRDTLNEKGFEVRIAYDGLEGLELFRRERPDVVVTDIMMPSMDGFGMVKKLRESDSSIPVLFLSARSSADDVVEGFETGGNDYLRKPFAMSELIVRVKALAGRALVQSTQNRKAETVFRFGHFIFNAQRCSLVIAPEGAITSEEVILSARESEILQALCLSAGEVVSIHYLLTAIWGSDTYFNNRSLNVFITHLRSRLKSDISVSIVNVRGVGYKLIH